MSEQATQMVQSEIHGIGRKGVVVWGGLDLVRVTSFLIVERSAWFDVTPLPNDEFRIIYKPEHHQAVLAKFALGRGAIREGAALSILALMEASWPYHGEPGEPYRDVAAAEIAINELIDYVRDRGCAVTYDNQEIGSPYGVVVRQAEGQG